MGVGGWGGVSCIIAGHGAEENKVVSHTWVVSVLAQPLSRCAAWSNYVTLSDL